MAFQIQIAVIGGEPDLSVLMQRLSEAVSEGESGYLGSFTGVDFVACEPQAEKAGEVLSKADAVIVGAAIASEEDGELVANTLRALRRLRNDKSGRNLLALSLWGSYARELAEQTSHPGVISPGAVAFDQPPVSALLLRVREWLEILREENQPVTHPASLSDPAYTEKPQIPKADPPSIGMNLSANIQARHPSISDTSRSVMAASEERRESEMSQKTAVAGAISKVARPESDPAILTQRVDDLEKLLNERDAQILALRARVETQKHVTETVTRAELDKMLSGDPGKANSRAVEQYKKQLAERDTLILELENQIESLKSTLHDAVEDSGIVSSRLAEFEGKLLAADERFINATQEASDAAKRAAAAESHAEELRGAVSLLTSNLSELQQQLQSARAEQQQLAEARRQAETELLHNEAEVSQRIEAGINTQLEARLEEARQQLLRDVARERAQERADFEARLQDELHDARQQVQQSGAHEIEKAGAELQAARAEIARLQQSLESAVNSQDELRNELQTLQLTRNSTLSEVRSELEQLREKHADELTAQQGLMTRAEEKTAAAEKQAEAFRERIDLLETSLEEREQHLEKMRSSMEELTVSHNSHQSEIAILMAARNAAQERVTELEAQCETEAQQAQQQTTAINRLTRQLRALESVYEETFEAHAKAKEELATVRGQQEEIQAAQARIAELENTQSASARQALALESLLKELTAERDQLQQQMQQLSNRAANDEQLQAELDALHAEKVSLQQQLDEVARKLAQSEKDVAEADELVQENLKLLAAHEAVRESLEQEEERNVVARKQIETLQQQIRELHARNEELANRVTDLHATSEEAQLLQQQLAETRQQARELDHRVLLAERSLAEQEEMDAEDLLLLTKLDEAVQQTVHSALNRSSSRVNGMTEVNSLAGSSSLNGAPALLTDSIDPLPIGLNEKEWTNPAFANVSADQSDDLLAAHGDDRPMNADNLLQPVQHTALNEAGTMVSMGDPDAEDELLRGSDDLMEFQDDPVVMEITTADDKS